MRLDLATVGIAGVLAVAAIVYSYSTALATMCNRNLAAWYLAERAADEWLTGTVSIEGVKVRVRDLVSGAAEEYGACARPIGYAYTFRLKDGSLYKVELWLCRPPGG